MLRKIFLLILIAAIVNAAEYSQTFNSRINEEDFESVLSFLTIDQIRDSRELFAADHLNWAQKIKCKVITLAQKEALDTFESQTLVHALGNSEEYHIVCNTIWLWAFSQKLRWLRENNVQDHCKFIPRICGILVRVISMNNPQQVKYILAMGDNSVEVEETKIVNFLNAEVCRKPCICCVIQ